MKRLQVIQAEATLVDYGTKIKIYVPIDAIGFLYQTTNDTEENYQVAFKENYDFGKPKGYNIKNVTATINIKSLEVI